ncbi:hypothetical protein [Pararhizobium mangrovi]|uniref:Uncharacterized protein n=1 Tax=Pararhizobium mangrovi TaxID=2590452 RepID=A0A506U0C5_9HYPH|nr:hypothetical protein [Pararhizobium mangrovi]TPW26918.1 hypothetical protein FJU11_13165 [Pararhizobium mangrovi]
MFLDLKNYDPPPEPWHPEPQKKGLSPRGEKVLLWLLFLNFLMLLIAPIGGATIVQGIIAIFQ